MNQAILLYRFLSAEAATKTIEGRAFRGSRLLELNDPFEWSAGVEGLEKLPPEKAELVNLDQERFLKQLNERFGIICFSATFRDPVLWSHYADSHRGLAIEVSHDLGESLHKVDYTDDRPTIHLPWAQNPAAYAEELREIFLAFFKRKSLGWSYEKEYRGVAELDSCDVAGGMFFKKIPEDLVTRIIIGYRSAVSPSYVRRALDSNGFAKVQVAAARRSNSTYEIEC